MPDEEDHRRAVHREQLVERVRRQDVVAAATASCKRISSASTPPMTRKTEAMRTYMMPIFL